MDWLTQKYYKYYFPKFAKQAGRIATVSNFTKTYLTKTYGIDSQKIDVVYNGVSCIIVSYFYNECWSVWFYVDRILKSYLVFENEAVF